MNSQSGNILFIILIALALLGALSAAVMNSSDSETANIDSETLSIRLSEVQRYVSELERGVNFIIQNGVSESDIRFAHMNAPSAYGDLSADTDKSDQVFHRDGGGAAYRDPPDRINDGTGWQFYGGSDLPSVGSDRADLIAVLPNVSRQFCEAVNVANGQSVVLNDTGTGTASGASAGDCLYMGATDGHFGDSTQFYTTPNIVDETTFAQDPNTSAARTALQACVLCARDSEYHFYHVLLAR